MEQVLVATGHTGRMQWKHAGDGSLVQTADRLFRRAITCLDTDACICSVLAFPTFSSPYKYCVRQEVGTAQQTSRYSTKSCSTYTMCHTCQHIHMYVHTQSPLPSLPAPHHSLHPSPSFPPYSPPLIPPLSATHLPAGVMDECRQSREHIPGREGDLVL